MIAEILLLLLQFIGELVLQTVFQVLVELGFRSVGEPFRRPRPVHPVLAAIGYAIFGAAIGAMSLWFFPKLFITTEWLREVNLIMTPLTVGGIMVALGAWRRKRHQELIRLDQFSYGFMFAFATALVRYTWGQ